MLPGVWKQFARHSRSNGGLLVVAEWLGRWSDTWATRVRQGRRGFEYGRPTTTCPPLSLWSIITTVVSVRSINHITVVIIIISIMMRRIGWIIICYDIINLNILIYLSIIDQLPSGGAAKVWAEPMAEGCLLEGGAVFKSVSTPPVVKDGGVGGDPHGVTAELRTRRRTCQERRLFVGKERKETTTATTKYLLRWQTGSSH